MSRKSENTGFKCENCGRQVEPVTNGSYRNHCPYCLCSKHVDVMPGDRASECGGIMEPVGADYNGAKGWMIIHRCRVCGHTVRNKVAENTVQSDSRELLMKLVSEK